MCVIQSHKKLFDRLSSNLLYISYSFCFYPQAVILYNDSHKRIKKANNFICDSKANKIVASAHVACTETFQNRVNMIIPRSTEQIEWL